ncbi:MAG: InlB B-repeat-containing protein [Methanobacteriaceae archaeon]|nr:InlB B-repeat-containing protein [Candidatus Methanorudis spinitermitis]
MKIKKIIVLLLFLVAIAGIIAPINATVDSNNSKTKTYSVESKEKSVKCKITWNANGGKFGSKKTITTYGKTNTKLGKLPTITPKRSGYKFLGWYSSKVGGMKITKNSVPLKTSVNTYAHWKKVTKK